MSEWNVEIVRINGVRLHQNANSLSLTNIYGNGYTGEGGYPVIFKSDTFVDQQLVVYIPIDSVMPDKPEYSFLYDYNVHKEPDGSYHPQYLDFEGKIKEKYRRVKAKKLRGIFSMGMLQPLPPLPEGKIEWQEGDHVHELLGITKYEPPMAFKSGECETDRGVLTGYTDIDGFRKYSSLFEEGEEVVLSEKIHGSQSKFTYHEGQLIIGSHRMIKKHPGDSVWSIIATQYDLENKLSKFPDMAIYGEVYGPQIQGSGFNYGVNKPALRIFDIMDLNKQKYLDYNDFINFCKKVELDTVPILYVGPWKTELMEMRNGKSTLANHVREGFVVKPIVESFSNKIGRKILKFVGEDYQLNKNS